MDIMELGAIGELVSGLAVVGSLLYVGLQVRQSNRLEKAESVRAVTRDYITTMLQADGALMRRALTDFEGLSEDEKMRAHNWLTAFYTVAETEIALSRQGLGEERNILRVVAGMTRTPGLKNWWDISAPAFSEEFGRFIEEAVAEQEKAGFPAPHEWLPWLSPESATPREA